MIWFYGKERPASVEVKLRLGQKQRTVNYNVERVTKDGESMYRWQSVVLDPGEWGYGKIVSAIVNQEYPADRMQAVVNNYLADAEDPEAAGEMQDMQDWRAFAKEVAKDALQVEGCV